MGLQKIVSVLLVFNLLFACTTKKSEKKIDPANNKETALKVSQPSKAQILIDKAIKAHGGDLYDTAHYSFNFRGDTYTFNNDGTNYAYSKIANKENSLTKDFLINGVFYRKVNNDTVDLNEKNIKQATGAINSVIYFATLPHKLNDEAVNATYIGATTIKGENYETVHITFNKEGGGEDFEDQFYYWIHTDTHKIDYLAYNYKVNNGGVRFRSAYNRRVIDGITFQDYINYKASTGTPLIELPKLYETEKLKEVSKIKTEHIINLNKNTQ